MRCSAPQFATAASLLLLCAAGSCVLMLCCCAGTSWSIRRAVMCATTCHSSSVWQTMTSFYQVDASVFFCLHHTAIETCIHRTPAQGALITWCLLQGGATLRSSPSQLSTKTRRNQSTQVSLPALLGGLDCLAIHLHGSSRSKMLIAAVICCATRIIEHAHTVCTAHPRREEIR